METVAGRQIRSLVPRHSTGYGNEANVHGVELKLGTMKRTQCFSVDIVQVALFQALNMHASSCTILCGIARLTPKQHITNIIFPPPPSISSTLSIPGHHTLSGPAEIHGPPGRVSCVWLHVLWGRVCKQRSKVSQRPLAGSQCKGGANLPARGCSSHTDLFLQDVRWNPDIVLELKATLVACAGMRWN